MSVSVHIADGPLPPRGAAPPAALPGAGAVVCFEGIVRELEGQGRVSALEYQVYEPMATGMLEWIARDLIARRRLIGVHVEHSRGRVPVGACSFRLVVGAPHRKEALEAMDEFIDRLKRDVPIWKTAVWAQSPGETATSAG
jgi:molybdopterin synthase catalytic subunit